MIDPPPWDFDAIVVAHARASPDLLDHETGGGEWLESLAYRPPRTVATEGWAPNVPVATARLQPLGVDVVEVDPAPDNLEQRAHESRGALPFGADSFSLVTARTASFVAREVARVLRPGGVFLTQQVGGDYGDFHEALGLPRPVLRERWDRTRAAEQLAAAGLGVVESSEGVETTTFADAGALSWYLRLIPWTVPRFSTAAYRANLERLHRQMPLRVELPAFWLKAVKPG